MNDYPTIQTVSTKREPTDSFLQTVPRMPVHATTAPAPSRSHHLSASYARINHDAGSVRKAALTRLDANLGALKYQIYEAQMASDHRRVCQLRGERQRLVEQKTTLEHKEDTSNIAPNQQPTWDNILPMTHPSLLRKLKTIHEVEVVLMFINKNITRAEAKGHFTEAKRLECERDTTRKYLHEMRAGQQLVHAAGLEDMQLVQQATEPERPMNRYNLDLVRFNGEPVIEKRGSSPPTSSDPTEDMADAVAQVSRLIKKVTDIEKSISSRTKGGAIESLGTALLTNVRGLLAKTEALAGRIIDREKTTVGVKQPEEGL
ncbi:MAG: hypothetical protein L6R39_005248 [Caloplaca ligustica]|nr:MAG: hypothetical protein L6R39_005248 [Caloplaca ligustica]